MKCSFMTFSCPDADLGGAIGMAQRYGYDGIEFRTESGHAHGVEPAATPADRARIRAAMDRANIQPACVATSCEFADPAKRADNLESARRHIELAGDLNCRRLRVFGGVIPPGVDRERAIRDVADALASLGDLAAKRNVVISLETHDDWCHPAHVLAVMTRANHPQIGVNWDIMHTACRAGVPMEEAWSLFGAWVCHAHVHDCSSYYDNPEKRVAFTPIGSGRVDHAAAIRCLKRSAYDGYLSGEWIRWESADAHLPREIGRLKAFIQGQACSPA